MKRFSKFDNWKSLCILPLLALFVWSCQGNESKAEEALEEAGDDIERTAEDVANTVDEETTVAANRASEAVDKLNTDFVMLKTNVMEFDESTKKYTPKEVEYKVYTSADKMPVYGVCDATAPREEILECTNKNILNAINEEIEYPASARQAGLEGRVVVSFVVPTNAMADKDGMIQIHNKTIVSSSRPAGETDFSDREKAAYGDMDQAVLDALEKIPSNWFAGSVDGKEANVQLTLPVEFRLAE